ncbi:MAG: DUF1295 domain-containing protein [Gammaproteobacteria bacterium]|nr:DUF1295 domain-containing protein [Gammaproteobacteria bacterium]
MYDFNIYFIGFAIMALTGLVTWLLSLKLHDVSIIDSVWSLLFLFASLVYVTMGDNTTPLGMLTLGLVGLWSIRLCLYLTYRNWNEPEDRRYLEMRDRHGDRFPMRSLYSVFGLQSVLAWVISMPLFGIFQSSSQIGPLAWAGALVVLFGIVFESIADLQLNRFVSDQSNNNRVLDSGLWRYSRHPNYFGEFCVWWGFYLIGLQANGWWTIISRLLMSLLLLRVSGVTLLEKDISSRRPGYKEYVERTSAFFPLPTDN